MKNVTFSFIVLFIFCILNIISLIELIAATEKTAYFILSIPVNQDVKILYYAILSAVLLYASLSEYKKASKR